MKNMRQITAILVGYMLAVVLCVSGIIMNSNTSSASPGSPFGGGKNPTLDIVLWVAIGIFTVAVIVATIVIILRARVKPRSNS